MWSGENLLVCLVGDFDVRLRLDHTWGSPLDHTLKLSPDMGPQPYIYYVVQYITPDRAAFMYRMIK